MRVPSHRCAPRLPLSIIPASLLILVALGCNPQPIGGREDPPPDPPSCTALDPASTTAGTPDDFDMTMTCDQVTSNSVVRWNGADRPTTMLSSIEAQATISEGDVATAGTADVTLFDPEDGTSNALTFTINNPVPVIANIEPLLVEAGLDLTLRIDGDGFIADSEILINGVLGQNVSPIVGSFVSVNQLQVDIAGTATQAGEVVQVTVENPGPGGGTSNSADLTINSPFPFITGITPSGVPVGGPDFDLEVDGGGFLTNSEGRWNGAFRPTTYVNDTRLRLAIAAADIALEGSADVTVFNPAPAGGESMPAAFTIDPPGGGGVMFDSIQLVSRNDAGEVANGGCSLPWLNLDARYVLYNSGATNLDPNDTNLVPDMFVHDLTARTNRRILTNFGQFANAPLNPGGISRDGRVVTFSATATDVDPLAVGGEIQATLHDRDVDGNGVFDEIDTTNTQLFSADNNGVLSDELIFFTGLSGNGRYAFFVSDAGIFGATLGMQQLFAVDRDADQDGVFDEIGPGERRMFPVSVNAMGDFANDFILLGGSGNHVAVSEDGSTVAIMTSATNLTNDAVTPGRVHVYAIGLDADGDGVLGEDGDHQAWLVTETLGGVEADGDADIQSNLDISPNERVVYFATNATNLRTGDGGSDTNGVVDVYSAALDANGDGVNGDILMVRKSVAFDGAQIDNDSRTPYASEDGRFVAFMSTGTNVVADPTLAVSEIFVHDTCLDAPPGCTPSTTWASQPDPAATPAGGGINDQLGGAAIDAAANRLYLAFRSSERLVPEDTDDLRDCFVSIIKF